MFELTDDLLDEILSDSEQSKLDDLFNQIMSERTGEWDGLDDESWHSPDLIADAWGEEDEEEKCTQ